MKYLLAFLFCWGLMGCGEAPHPKTLLLNREGAQLYKQQNFQAALDKFIEALRYDPYQAEIHLNMGLAFEGLSQPEKALQSYRHAQELAKIPFVKFMALFDEAQLLAKDKKVDEALAAYQRALEIVPTSKEAKTNIELLTQDQQGKGGSDGDKEKKDNKDKGQGQDKDKKDDKDGKDKDKDKKDDKKDPKDPDDKEKKDKEDKTYKNSGKYQPRKFEGKDLSESDVKKILGELRQQEQKIRADFNRKEVKEAPHDKDW